jgi:hypothetical protein
MYAADGRPSIPPERLLEHAVAQRFFDEVVVQADGLGLLSDAPGWPTLWIGSAPAVGRLET